MNPINFAIDFVAASSGASVENIDVSNGISASLFCLMALLVVAIVFVVLQSCKTKAFESEAGASMVTNQRKVLSGTFTKVLCIALAVLLAMFAIGMLVQNQAFASADDQDDPFVNRITATVDTENGTVRIPAFNLKNTDGFAYRLTSAKVAISEEATGIAGLENSILTVNGFGGCVCNSVPNGVDNQVLNLIDLEANEETELTFGIDNLDKETALALCGRTGFTLSLIPSAICKIDTNNEADIITQVNSVAPPTKAGYTFETWNTKEDGTGINVSSESFESSEASLDNVAGTLNLYPLFSENVGYTVNYETFGGSPVAPLTNVSWTDSNLLPVKDPSKDGFKFNGWYYGKLKDTEASSSTTYSDIAGSQEKSSVTLYANWSPIYYEVVCDMTGTTFSSAPNGWTKVGSTDKYMKKFFSDCPYQVILDEWKNIEFELKEGFTSEEYPGTDSIWPSLEGTLNSTFEFSPRVTGLNYQVCIWGMNHDTYDSNPANTNPFTFGPAIGEDTSCLDVNGKEDHEPCSDGQRHCIHEDSWDDIIENINNHGVEYYSQCLDYGCTKSVPIFMNTTLGSKVTQKKDCSVLYRTILLSYKNFNNSIIAENCESANYASSRIRATLNGHDDWDPSSCAELSSCLDSSNCLLSCFPKVLQDKIKPKYMKVATSWDIGGTRPIKTETTITDQLWLMNANEIYKNVIVPYDDYRSQYKKAENLQITVTTSDSAKGFDEIGSAASCWLRSPYRTYRYYAGIVVHTGELNSTLVTFTFGISPCFCL